MIGRRRRGIYHAYSLMFSHMQCKHQNDVDNGVPTIGNSTAESVC